MLFFIERDDLGYYEDINKVNTIINADDDETVYEFLIRIKGFLPKINDGLWEIMSGSELVGFITSGDEFGGRQEDRQEVFLEVDDVKLCEAGLEKKLRCSHSYINDHHFIL